MARGRYFFEMYSQGNLKERKIGSYDLIPLRRHNPLEEYKRMERLIAQEAQGENPQEASGQQDVSSSDDEDVRFEPKRAKKS